ncbi:MAG: esterase family protein [Scytolyngbya sp. HA4215-MV1]|jgi:enterochelin esterase-like enzyme|nr:esterase family protein [Scytolyngbya sp. HA4215-MV1]
MKFQRVLGMGVALVSTLAVGGYWYLFVEGCAPLNALSAQAAEATDLAFQLVPYNSQVLGMSRTYGLVLPPGYKQHSQQQYPVIFLLHGGHGNATDWNLKGNALPVIQQLYNTQRLPAAIFITPDGNDLRGSSPFWDPQYINGPHGKVLTAIGDELVQVVKSRYRTKPSPQFWAIGGLSSGGWGAMNIGLHRLQNFSILFSHSGYFTDKSGAENSPLAYVHMLNSAQRASVSIYLDAGEGDKKYLTESRQFHQELDRLGIANVFHSFPGGHGLHGADVGWNYWHQHLADSLSFVGDRFRDAQLFGQAKSKTGFNLFPQVKCLKN